MLSFASTSEGLFFFATTHSVQNRPLNHLSNVGTSFFKGTPLAASFSARSICTRSAASAASLVFTSGLPEILILLPSGRWTTLRYLHLPSFSRRAGIGLLPLRHDAALRLPPV